MKPTFLIPLGLSLVMACSKNKETDTASSSTADASSAATAVNYKQYMRNFVQGISKYAKSTNANFLVVPQNGIELVTTNGESTGSKDTAYLNAIDANGQEDLYYGYDNDDQSTPSTPSSSPSN